MKYLIVLSLLLSSFAFARESAEFADKVATEHGLSATQAQRLKVLLTGDPMATRNIGTEDPAVLIGPHHSYHPASRATCQRQVMNTGLIRANPEYEKYCGAKWMAPVPDKGQPLGRARVCIDQFEFPDLPCEYPMVWTPAPFAKKACEAMGKRVCNSHEWEGACAGGIETQNPYLFNLPDLNARRAQYNAKREKIWAYQWNPELKSVTDTRSLCGVYNVNDPDFDPSIKRLLPGIYNELGKSNTCQNNGSDYDTCGTNSWPSGFKYLCRTETGVFDMHGNLAEVMSFPTSPAEIADSRGVTGHTERKGSFFVYRGVGGMNYPDDCRVRQPYEHFGEFATDKMSYYQEGFRCCKDVE